MIKTFNDKQSASLWQGKGHKRLPRQLHRSALRKLFMLDNAKQLVDLRSPPGNKLEALKGDRKGQHSVRINDQWRICFRWRAENCEQVEIVDYH